MCRWKTNREEGVSQRYQEKEEVFEIEMERSMLYALMNVKMEHTIAVINIKTNYLLLQS